SLAELAAMLPRQLGREERDAVLAEAVERAMLKMLTAQVLPEITVVMVDFCGGIATWSRSDVSGEERLGYLEIAHRAITVMQEYPRARTSRDLPTHHQGTGHGARRFRGSIIFAPAMSADEEDLMEAFRRLLLCHLGLVTKARASKVYVA